MVARNFTPIIATELKSAAMRLELLNAMRKFGTKVKVEFRKTTETWEENVKFDQQTISLKGGASVTVETDNEKYRWMNDGTKKRDIVPKKPGGVLVFRANSKPKTKRGVIGSTAGSKGGELIFTKIVKDHEIEARNFDTQIAKKMQPVFVKDMQAAMKKVRDVSGHAI